MSMPNFLIVGAAKAGTTSLYHYLKQHPQIFMSALKEPKFFALEGKKLNFNGPSQHINTDSVNNLKDYRALFADVTTEKSIGEASPLYLYDNQAAKQIHSRLPEAKLIVILRDPVERAFSSFAHLVREGYETLSFEEGLAEENKRIQENWAPLWYYQDKGFYYEQLKRYYKLFAASQIKVYLFEELCNDPMGLLRSIYNFLGVDADFVPDLTKCNVSGVPKSKAFQALLTQKNPIKSAAKALLPGSLRRSLYRELKTRNLGEKPVLSVETRHQLQALYREDTLQLQTLINRDLSHWLTPEYKPIASTVNA